MQLDPDANAILSHAMSESSLTIHLAVLMCCTLYCRYVDMSKHSGDLQKTSVCVAVTVMVIQWITLYIFCNRIGA